MGINIAIGDDIFRFVHTGVCVCFPTQMYHYSLARPMSAAVEGDPSLPSNMTAYLWMEKPPGFGVPLWYRLCHGCKVPHVVNLDGTSNAGKMAVYFMNGFQWLLLG